MKGETMVEIFTDGAARGNPDGPGGYGAILRFTDSKGETHETEISAGYDKTTNNRMEMMAAIAALELLQRPCDVTVTTDSQYLTNTFNKGWIDNWRANGWRNSANKPVKNLELWQRLIRAAANHTVTWKWVKGHNGHRENERCDALAVAAAEQPQEKLLHDDGKAMEGEEWSKQ